MKQSVCLFIAWFCGVLPLWAQLERGTVLLSPGLGYSEAKRPQFAAATTGVLQSSLDRYMGAALQVGVVGKKHREWGLGVSYEQEKKVYKSGPDFSPVDIRVQRKYSGGLYHRKYFSLNSRWWVGYQIQLMATVYSFKAEYTKLPEPAKILYKEPVKILLDANGFVGGFITPRLGARLSLGSASLGYLFKRDGFVYGLPPTTVENRVEAGLGWNPAGATRFSLVWALRAPGDTQ